MSGRSGDGMARLAAACGLIALMLLGVGVWWVVRLGAGWAWP